MRKLLKKKHTQICAEFKTELRWSNRLRIFFYLKNIPYALTIAFNKTFDRYFVTNIEQNTVFPSKFLLFVQST